MVQHADQATPLCPQPHASARKVESLIRSRVAERSQKTVAFDMGTDTSAVSRWLSGQTGIPLQDVGGLLDALCLEVVPREELAALRMFAGRHLLGGGQ